MSAQTDRLIQELHVVLGKMEVALGAVRDSIVWTDHEGKIEWCNASFDRLMGQPHIYLLGTGLTQVLRLERKGAGALKLEQPLALLLAGRNVVRGRYLLAGGDSKMELEISATSIETMPNQTTHVFWIRDVTERTRMEEERLRLTQQLKEANRELVRSNTELQEFAYVASHDLQEPLRMVASFTKLLEKRYKGRLDKDADEFIHFIVDGATRMHRLINDLLEYARVESRGKPLKPVSCEEALSQVKLNLRILLEQKKARLISAELPAVLGDAGQVAQLFQNLIGNAVKFSGPRFAEIRIQAERQNGFWRFSVSDNGIGIEPQYFERIFGLFQRLHGQEFPGTGLGLAICKRIVERHGGRIWVESQPNKGTTFFFTLKEVGHESS